MMDVYEAAIESPYVFNLCNHETLAKWIASPNTCWRNDFNAEEDKDGFFIVDSLVPFKAENRCIVHNYNDCCHNTEVNNRSQIICTVPFKINDTLFINGTAYTVKRIYLSGPNLEVNQTYPGVSYYIDFGVDPATFGETSYIYKHEVIV